MKTDPPSVYTVTRRGKRYRYVRVQVAGHRRSAPLTNAWLTSRGGRATADEGRRAAAIAAILRRELDEAPARRQRLGEAVEAFLAAQASLGQLRRPSDGMIARRRSVLLDGSRRRSSLLASLGDIPLQRVRSRDLLAFEAHLSGAGYSSESVRAYMKDVKTFFHWADGEGLLRENPAAPASYQLPPTGNLRAVEAAYTPQEMVALDRALRSADPRLRRAFLVISQTGVRRGEYCRLTSDMLGDCYLQVPGASKNPAKEARVRHVPLTREMQRFLRSTVIPPGAFFATGTASSIAPRTMSGLATEFSRVSGLKLGLQRLRRTYGQRLFDSGEPLHLVAERLGNTAETCRQWYVIPSARPLSDREERALSLGVAAHAVRRAGGSGPS